MIAVDDFRWSQVHKIVVVHHVPARAFWIPFWLILMDIGREFQLVSEVISQNPEFRRKAIKIDFI